MAEDTQSLEDKLAYGGILCTFFGGRALERAYT
jgi:hypothetical protein